MKLFRTSTRIAAITAAVVLAFGGLSVTASPSAQASLEGTALPAIDELLGEAGFRHPGVGVTADHLENMREQVHADVEPWASYYDAMTQTRYASATFRATIQGDTDDQPTETAYDDAGMRSRQHADSIGAMTQALLYYVTGDEQHRANALHVLRTWSSLDPDQYEYFADAHIHTGVPLYYMLFAADILRTTEPANASLDGYELRWTDRDQQRIEDNLIRPVLDTFLGSQNRLWNQHLYGVIGSVAAAIYLDDAELYAERVEWFSVNSTFDSDIPINGGDVNGSLAALIRVIDAEDPLNTTGEDFLQVMEMGRDQAHAEGDIDLLAAIARVIDNQGTRLDPGDGTVSDDDDAVTPYEFLDNRILGGTDVFAAFMMGEELPWVDTSGGAGKLSEAYRGRLREPMSEAYYQYEYVVGVDVEREAPFVAEMHENGDGPIFAWGDGTTNFWNESGSDFTGAEYWVAFPEELADEDVQVPPPGDAALQLSQFGHALGKHAKHRTDDDGTTFVRLDPKKDEASVAVRHAVWPTSRVSPALVGLKVRTREAVVLEIGPTSAVEPRATIQLPNTDGEWRYVWIDLSEAPQRTVGSYIAVLSATDGNAPVDIQSVLADAGSELDPPRFADGGGVELVAVAGEPLARDLGATDSGGNFSLELQGAPENASLSADGLFEWVPATASAHRFLAVASDELADTALAISVEVAPDRVSAIDALVSRLGDPAEYTSATWQAVAEARDAALAGADGAEPTAFGQLLEDLRAAVEETELLNPLLTDGTLDYSGLVTSADLTPDALANIVDGDNQTFWGDIRRPSVQMDFGSAHRFRADAIGWLARDTFPDRSHGANAYGSNDGEEWTLLTEYGTAGDDVEIETIPVRDAVRNETFRYLKLQADEPTHVIFSMADIRIHGERTEVGVDTLLEEAKAHDLSPYSRGSALLFTREIADIEAAAVEPDADRRSLALDVQRAWELLEDPPLQLEEIAQDWVLASSPSWDGSRDAAHNGWAMFDGDETTFTDTETSNGWVRVRPDDGTTLHITALRYLPRAGYLSRAEGMRFEASTDAGATWEPLATISGARDGWNRIDLDAPADAKAFRVNGSGGMNLAEVELVSSTLDRSAMELLLRETAELAAADWTAESWQELADARASAEILQADSDADQPRVDAAADALAAAANGLAPR
ncbi:alginate lyase family protein [Microbacterium karelineae]|uniref:alginate lyase family protein n=1 Tax=Microbacterium karelineae TaxID=2654283 RepID=UPI0012E9A81B|nr:alginate lyase family protein [Microbacterium karelineae]